jgi:dethiobiotin synthetase
LLSAELVVMAGPELGTLNVTELTVEAARHRGVRVRGIVVGRWPEQPGEVERQNLLDLPVLAGAPLLGVVPQLAPGQLPTVVPAR